MTTLTAVIIDIMVWDAQTRPSLFLLIISVYGIEEVRAAMPENHELWVAFDAALNQIQTETFQRLTLAKRLANKS